MSFFKRLLGMESCNGMFHYPLFMTRKEKVNALDGMIKLIEKSGKKKKCDICKNIFNEKMSRWSKDDLNSSICIVCHKKFWNKKCGEYSYSEQKELRKLKSKVRNSDVSRSEVGE